MFNRPPKYDYAKIISVGMPFLYEAGKKVLSRKMPRWDYNSASVGWIDHGKTGLLYEAEVLSIQDDSVLFHLSSTGGNNYIVPLSKNASMNRGAIFNPYQWEWDGFFQPDGGWDQYLPVSQKKICGCGAEGLARITGQPVTGHGVTCEKWSPNPYQG